MNYWGEDDYTAAWGNEADYYNGYEYDEWEYGYGDTNYIGNQGMMLEHGTTAKTHTNDTVHDDLTTTFTKVSGERDPLKGVEQPKPVIVYNKYQQLTEDDSDSDEDNETSNKTNLHRRHDKTHNPNKRQ